jgi:DNA replication protein DnaC
MNLIELNRALHQLRLGGMVATLETRLQQAQTESMVPIDLISTLVSDELTCRSKRLLDRRHKQAQFRDNDKRLDNFDFQFNVKMNRALVFDLASAAWVGKREDALFLGPQAAGKVTSRKPSATQSSSRVIGFSIAKPMCYWRSWLTPRSTANAKNTLSFCPWCHC